MAELRPGMFTSLFAKVGEEAIRRHKQSLTAVALAIEREAKINAGKGGSHKYGTKTPASPGGPPAIISGTLRRSVTHTPVAPAPGLGFEVKVGLAKGVYPPYGKTRTASSLYGLYLETGLRNGTTYPWFVPAYRAVLPKVRGITIVEFHKGIWPHI